MAELNLGSDEWSAVRVGPQTVGWAGPYQNGFPLRKANITVMMGDRKLTLAAETVSALFHFVPREHALQQNNHKERVFVQDLLGYSRCFAVTVPNDSLDIADGNIAYTDRSLDILYVVLYKFFTAYVAEIQSDLHAMNPIEVVRKFAELCYYNFPDTVYENLAWRGRKLNDIPQGTTIQAKAIRTGPFARYPYLQFPGSLTFDSFVEWQTRTAFNSDRILPESVFLIKTSSQEEYEMVEQWFGMPYLMEMYLTRIRPNEEDADASFFLCQDGDVLEDWIDGEIMSVKDFSRAMFRAGAPPRKKAKKQ